MGFRKRVEHTREFTPNVIEPSFGIGRILYALIEHNFWTRGSEGTDEARGVLSFPPPVAPTKVLIVPLSSNQSFKPHLKKLSQRLRSIGISSRVDDSSGALASVTAATMNLALPWASPLISRPFKTTRSLCVTVTQRAWCALRKTRSSRPSSRWWTRARPGRISRRSFPHSRVRRLTLL